MRAVCFQERRGNKGYSYLLIVHLVYPLNYLPGYYLSLLSHYFRKIFEFSGPLMRHCVSVLKYASARVYN